MSLDPLEQRLTDMAVDAPDAGRITARVLSLGARPRRRRVFRLPAVGLSTIALAVAIIYFVPTADAVLARVPVAGDLLRQAGLSGAADQVTAVGAISDSSGFKLTLVGAYADSTRTVLLLHAEPAIIPGDAQLTDQFGRRYQESNGYGDARTGDLVMQFEPLAWPDSITGARITLGLNQVQAFYYDPAIGDWRIGSPVAGSWTMSAILGVDESRILALPAGGRVGGANCRFTSASASSATILVDFEMSGVTQADLSSPTIKGDQTPPIFDVQLIGPTGEVAPSSYGLSDTDGGVVVHFVAYRLVAGDYVLRVSFRGDHLDRALHVS